MASVPGGARCTVLYRTVARWSRGLSGVAGGVARGMGPPTENRCPAAVTPHPPGPWGMLKQGPFEPLHAEAVVCPHLNHPPLSCRVPFLFFFLTCCTRKRQNGMEKGPLKPVLLATRVMNVTVILAERTCAPQPFELSAVISTN